MNVIRTLLLADDGVLCISVKAGRRRCSLYFGERVALSTNRDVGSLS